MNAMKYFRWSCCLILLASLGAWSAQQDSQQSQPPAPSATQRLRGRGQFGGGTFGTVVSVGVDQFEIKKGDGTSQTVFVNDQTSYREGQKGIALEDLQANDHVMVRGEVGANNHFVAALVRRMSPEEMARFQNGGERAFGQIEAINGNQIKINSRFRGEMTVVVNDQTTFTKEEQPSALKDLKIGDRIFAEGKETGGQFIATRVSTGQFRRGQGMRPGGGPPQ